MGADMAKVIDSVCTYCGVGCDIAAEIEDGRIRRIYARDEGVVSRGRLCIKGKWGYEFLDHPNRVRGAYVKKRFVDEHPELFAGVELTEYDPLHYAIAYEDAYRAVAQKIARIQERLGSDSVACIGGARTSCESGYLFQKLAREILGTPHVDNCARVCHSPSLKGMRATIGEGAATNPFDDIYEAEHILVVGSNTTEAHPIVANRILEAVKKSAKLSIIDVRRIPLSKFAHNHLSIPYETNLMILNMIARVIVEDGWVDEAFIKSRCAGYEEYKEQLLADPFADPQILAKVRGYEELPQKIRELAYDLSHRKSLILWGLGVTEHIDGSYGVMALVYLALLTGNVGKAGAGLMPLRGQNNVQGTCDMGMLPYYLPDYQKPKTEGLMTPDIVDAVLAGRIGAILNMGEDLAHIHPNQTKVHRALSQLELLCVQEVMWTEVTRYAHFVFGVKSGYEKRGVYVNAERRLHLSEPLVECDLPDDWEVIAGIGRHFDEGFVYESGEVVWDEVRAAAPKRFGGASYERLAARPLAGLQWPVESDGSDTPRLHQKAFRTEDGLGHFRYHPYALRGMFKELLDGRDPHFYLTTGRTLAHYNNAAQTKASERLDSRYPEDILIASTKDREFFEGREKVILKSVYGSSKPLRVHLSDTIQRGTLYVTFHHAKSHINYLFGDEADEFVKTARFKSVKVTVH
jgi:formate dehydrogenase major subunit